MSVGMSHPPLKFLPCSTWVISCTFHLVVFDLENSWFRHIADVVPCRYRDRCMLFMSVLIFFLFVHISYIYPTHSRVAPQSI